MKYEAPLGPDGKFAISADIVDGMLVIEASESYKMPLKDLVSASAVGIINKLEGTSIGQMSFVHSLLEDIKAKLAEAGIVAAAPAPAAAPAGIATAKPVLADGPAPVV